MTTSTTSAALDGHRYLIVGGAGGIGSALARRLAARGARLVLAGRTEGPLAALASELDADTAILDARDFDAVEDAVRRAAGDGVLSGAANCVGSILLKPAHLTSAEELDETLGLNLRTAFALVRAVGRARPRDADRPTHVALVSTAAAAVGLANHDAIAAAKAGVDGLVRSAAATYAGAGIRVNAVAPGLVDTPLAARITGNPRALETSRRLHPVGRIGRPDDVARALEWLLDPAADWVTGQVVGVDGGMAGVRVG